jgi:hypothetical protein
VDHIYQISYFYGFATSLTVYALLYVIFPAERQRGSSPFVLEMHAEMLDGREVEEGSGSGVVASDEEKGGARPKIAAGVL